MHDEVRLGVHGDEARLDVPVARELLQRDLRVGAEDDVRVEVVLARGLAGLLPPLFHREAAEHDRLGRTRGRGADGVAVFGRVPEVGDCVKILSRVSIK